MPRTAAAARRRQRAPRYSERRRVLVTMVLAVIAALACGWFLPWQLTVLVGFDAMAVAQLVWIWVQVLHRNAAETKALATVEDDSRSASRLVVVGAAMTSLIAVVFALAKEKHLSQPMAGVMTGAAVFTVAVSWVLVHSTFVLRYAHLYYAGKDGGIDFPGSSAPDYRDFAYIAFTVGMSFTVAETPPTTPAMRRLITAHALLSYLFGAVIVGMVINVMAGLIG